MNPSHGTPTEGLPLGACRKCGGVGVWVVPNGAHAHADVCECARHCQVCQNSRYLFERDAQGRELARMCECERRRVRVRMFNEAQVPGKYADARLEPQFRDAANAETFDTLKLAARHYKRNQKGLLLMGASGVGKTWLVSAFVYELIFQHGIPVMFRDFFHLLGDLRSGYSQDIPESELIGPLLAVEVLVVDELGKGRNTPWELTILDSIISQRYNAQKTTVFTSNYTESRNTTLPERFRPRDGPAADGDAVVKDLLSERVGRRIFSRLKEMCDFITLSGTDRRDGENSGDFMARH